MGKIKGSKAHALAVHDGSHNPKQRFKSKDKGKAHANPKKEGNAKPFNDSSGSKGEKWKKMEKCTYCQKGFHPEFSCMKKQIDQMAQILQKHNLRDHIPEAAKKNPKDHAPEKGNSSHAVIAINSSPYAWVVD